MSVRSMTGYGRAAVQAGGLRVEVDLSSVNRKQLDISLNLPKALAPLEARVHEAIGHALHRGRVTAEIRVRGTRAARRQAIRVDVPLASSYLAALRGAARRLRLRDDLSAARLLDLPGVLRVESPEEDAERTWPLLARALRRALGSLDRMRAREGRALARDLLKRVRRMERLASEIRRRGPAAVARYRDSLRQRMRDARADVPVTDERLERELIVFADKSDISEELTRLASHLAQARALLLRREPSGKALDFLAQEMYREINTTGAKANDAGIAGRVVLFKTELDRFREQVQNIE